MALSVTQLYEVMAQLPDPIFILSEGGYYVEYIGGMEQQSYHDGNPLAGKQLADVLPPRDGHVGQGAGGRVAGKRSGAGGGV